MPGRVFTLAAGDGKLWAALARRMGGCAEGTDWFDRHPWEDILRGGIDEPYPVEWAYWGLRHMGHRAAAPLRDIYIQKIAADPFLSMIAWQQIDDLTEDEAATLLAAARAEYPDFIKRAESGEWSSGFRSEQDPKLSDPDA